MGIVYLIQPEEFKDLNIFKLGISKKDNCQRLYQYGSGVKIISVKQVSNPLLIEKELKKNFRDKFTIYQGYEYFEGDQKEMEELFDKIVFELKDEDEEEEEQKDNEKDDKYSEEDENMKQIKEVFPNYMEDEEFGGKKELVKINIKGNTLECYSICSKEIVKTDRLHGLYSDESISIFEKDYIKKIINSGVIIDGIIYDMKNKTFLKDLEKHKKKYKNIILDEKIKKEIIQNIFNYSTVKLFSSAILYFNFQDIEYSVFCEEYYMKELEDTFILDLQCGNHYKCKPILLGKNIYDNWYIRNNFPSVIWYNDSNFIVFNEKEEYNCHKIIPEDKWDIFDKCKKEYFQNPKNDKDFKQLLEKYTLLTRFKTRYNPNNSTFDLKTICL